MKSVGQIVCAQGTNVIERNVQMRLFQPCHKQVKRKLLGSYHGMMTTAQRCVLKEKKFWPMLLNFMKIMAFKTCFLFDSEVIKCRIGCNHHKVCASFLRCWGPLHSEKISETKISWCRKCLMAGNVSWLDMSQGWTCLGCLKLLLYKKAEKERLVYIYLGAILVQALLVLTCLGAGLVSGPDLSQGRPCLGAGLVSGPDLSKNFGPEVSKS